jgi:hypothetical protein
MNDCGGCVGLGAHKRWCPAVVGRHASIMGRWSEQADQLADSVGANCADAANHLYAAAALLRKAARERATGTARNRPAP